jgi:hypothetical protein
MSKTITNHPSGEQQHSIPEIVRNNVRNLLGLDLVDTSKESSRNDKTHHAVNN